MPSRVLNFPSSIPRTTTKSRKLNLEPHLLRWVVVHGLDTATWQYDLWLFHMAAGPVVEKLYEALVEDSPSLAEEGWIQGVLPGGGGTGGRPAQAGQPARTRYRCLRRSRGGFALLELQPVTGA